MNSLMKAECRRIDAFELWCWRRFLRVPWTARRSNQSILKEISPGATHFHVADGILTCHYCEKEQDINKVELV